jgi:methionine-rich copper-binding protein CopC
LDKVIAPHEINEVKRGYTSDMRASRLLLIAALLAIPQIYSSASAHTVIVSASPAENAILEVLPSTISITFAEDLINIGDSNSISVVDQAGSELALAKPLVSGAVLTSELSPTQSLGMFKVSYRAVAADGHVITGEYGFTVSPKAVVAQDIKTPAANSSLTDSDNKLSIYLIISATLVVGGGLLLFFIWKRQ